VFKSTGKRLKYEAKQYAETFLKQDRSTEITLQKYAEDFFIWDKCEWIKRQRAKNRAFSQHQAKVRRGHLENYIFPNFGKYHMDKITPVEVENWLISLKRQYVNSKGETITKPLSSQTKNHIMYTLTIIMREAFREKKIKKNSLETIEALAVKPKKTDAFSTSELKLMFPVDDKQLLTIWHKREYSALFLLMVTSGIRLGEARALMWKHIIWDLGAIFIMQAWKADKSLGEPKANEKRGIYIPTRTLTELKKWQDESIFKEPDSLVFYGEWHDKPLNSKTVYKYFMAGIEKTEIDTTDRNLRPHSLRHTYNTMMRNILPETVLREFTGHRSESMTNNYDSRDFLEERLNKLSDSKKLIEGVWQ